MTILYKVESRNFSKGSVFPQKIVLCSISAKNIAAFSVLQDIDTSLSEVNYECDTGFNNHIYVCDIVTPWQYYKVCSSKTLINVLEWSPAAEYLFLGHRGGNIEIWIPKNYSLNCWSLLHTANIPHEDIIYAKWFHNGKGFCINSQKKELTFYAEKFDRLDLRSTLCSLGGAASEGCIVVTSSGLLGAFTIPKLQGNAAFVGHEQVNAPQVTELSTSIHSIGLMRNYISRCAISYCNNGALNLALSFGWKEQLVYFYKANLMRNGDDQITISTESQGSIFLNTLEHRNITQLKLARIGNEDVIFIVYTCDGGSGSLEQWNFARRHQSVHALLQQNKGDYIQNELWEHNATMHFPVGISDICVPKLLTDSMQIYVILKDNSVQVLEPGLKKICHTQFDRYSDSQGCKFICGDLSPTNQILFVFDNNAQILAMQAPNAHSDKNFKMCSLSLQVLYLEYCIITGTDASDVLMLNLNNLDALIEKLTENFTRQPAFTRHFYYSNFLALKSNICRIQSRQQDFDNLIILHSISITFKSLLRPAELNYQDKSPAENLSMILTEPMSDVDNVLLNLDAKDFTVEPLTLQSIQTLIQWVSDLALNMLNKLPEEIIKAKMNKRQGYDISRDIVAIGSIRELLVMVRIWGLLNPLCLPIYTKSMDNIDVLAILFRLLTRLAQNTAEPDDVLLDECNSLSKQVLIPLRHSNNATTLLSTMLSTNKPMMLVFSTLVEPVGLQEVQMEDVLFSTSIRDGVSNLQLGSRARPIRKCARCGFVNSLNKVAKTTALRAWYNKWLHCHCGGFWKLIN